MDPVFTPLPQGELSQYHGGLSKVYRLDAIRKQIHLYRTQHDFDHWFEWLFAWRSELAPLMKREKPGGQAKGTKQWRPSYGARKKYLIEVEGKEVQVSEYKYHVNLFLTAKDALKAIRRKENIEDNVAVLQFWEDELGYFEQKMNLGTPYKEGQGFGLSS